MNWEFFFVFYVVSSGVCTDDYCVFGRWFSFQMSFSGMCAFTIYSLLFVSCLCRDSHFCCSSVKHFRGTYTGFFSVQFYTKSPVVNGFVQLQKAVCAVLGGRGFAPWPPLEALPPVLSLGAPPPHSRYTLMLRARHVQTRAVLNWSFKTPAFTSAAPVILLTNAVSSLYTLAVLAQSL